jgi:hypothetical protein
MGCDLIPAKQSGSHDCAIEIATGTLDREHFDQQDISNFVKGMIMATNKTRGGTPQQHAEAGRQSHKNDGNKQSGSGSGSRSGGSGGTRGGTPEQHAEAGRQSHKNDGKR